MRWPLLLALAASLSSGCATARPPSNTIQIGDATEKVQAAYGKPDRKYKRLTSGGEVETWGYMPYWVGFGMPTEPIGSRGSLSSDIPLEPIRDDEDVRVFFKNGKVIAVEYRASK